MRIHVSFYAEVFLEQSSINLDVDFALVKNDLLGLLNQCVEIVQQLFDCPQFFILVTIIKCASIHQTEVQQLETVETGPESQDGELNSFHQAE